MRWFLHANSSLICRRRMAVAVALGLGCGGRSQLALETSGGGAPDACEAGACSHAPVGTDCPWGRSGGACRVSPAAVLAISAGWYHTCAITADGALKCWGSNESAELGNDSTVYSPIPVDVVELSSGIVAVSAAWFYTCALTATGAVECWGSNQYGQLGDDSTTKSPVPVEAVGLSSGVLSVSAGMKHTCALTSAGAVKCWGQDASGQLGDNSVADSSVPVDVAGF